MFDLLGKILLGLAVAGAVGAAAVIIKGVIDKRKIKQELAKKNINKAIIDMINKTDNVITLKDLENYSEFEIKGDGISDELYEGQTIYA